MPLLFGCFARKTDYLKMEKIQYKALKLFLIAINLILHSNKVSIHQKQLRQLTTEIYKSLTDLSPEFIKPFFTVKEIPYDFRNGQILNLPSTRTTYYGTNSILFNYLVCCQIISSRSIHIP